MLKSTWSLLLLLNSFGKVEENLKFNQAWQSIQVGQYYSGQVPPEEESKVSVDHLFRKAFNNLQCCKGVGGLNDSVSPLDPKNEHIRRLLVTKGQRGSVERSSPASSQRNNTNYTEEGRGVYKVCLSQTMVSLQYYLEPCRSSRRHFSPLKDTLWGLEVFQCILHNQEVHVGIP